MAARSTWKGLIPVAGPVKAYVEAIKATDDYAGAAVLKEVCACHHQPFAKKSVCAVSNVQRATEGVVKAGQTGAAMVKAVEKAPGEFVEIDAGTLAQVEEQIDSDEIAVQAIVSVGEVEWENVMDLAYLRARKDLPGADQAVTLLYALLATGKVLVGKLTKGGREQLVAIHAAKGALCMSRLRYAAEVREPEPLVTAIGAAAVPAQGVSMLEELLDREGVPTNCDLTVIEDESVKLKAAAIAAVLAGEPAAPREAPAAPEPVAKDLMAELSEAMQAGKPAPAKAKATAGKKVKA